MINIHKNNNFIKILNSQPGIKNNNTIVVSGIIVISAYLNTDKNISG